MSTPETGAGWMPKLNAAGEVTCSGEGEVFARGVKVAAGFGPVWLERSIVYGVEIKTVSGVETKTAIDPLEPGVKPVLVEGYNERHSGGSQWAGARPGLIHRYIKDTRVGPEIAGGLPRLSASGRFGYVTDYSADQHTLMVDGNAVVRGAITEIAIDDSHVAWIIAISMYGRDTFVDGVKVNVDTTENGVWLFDGWVMTYANGIGGYRIRPIGEDLGYLWLTSNAYYPDVRILNGRIIIATSTSQGHFYEYPIDLATPRVNLRDVAPVPAPVPVPVPPVPVPPPTPEPKTMRLPDGVQQIVNALYAAHLDLANGTDDQRRSLTQLIVEQTVFSFPGEGWGWKSADPNRPLSKDSIAKQQDGRLLNFDLFNGGTRQPNDHPQSEDITGQTFRPWPGVDHLGVAPAEPGAPTPPPSTPPQSTRSGGALIDGQLAALLMRVNAQDAKIAALEARPTGGGGDFHFPVRVAIRTDNGNYVSAEGGGGSTISADRPIVDGWERFTLEKQ